MPVNSAVKFKGLLLELKFTSISMLYIAEGLGCVLSFLYKSVLLKIKPAIYFHQITFQ